MIRITFACGHKTDLENAEVPPVCQVCGERRVQAVKAPAPRFTGSGRSPLMKDGHA